MGNWDPYPFTHYEQGSERNAGFSNVTDQEYQISFPLSPLSELKVLGRFNKTILNYVGIYRDNKSSHKILNF